MNTSSSSLPSFRAQQKLLQNMPVSNPDNFAKLSKDSIKSLKIRPKLTYDVELNSNEKKIEVDKVPMLLRYLKNHWVIHSDDQGSDNRRAQKREHVKNIGVSSKSEEEKQAAIRKAIARRRIQEEEEERLRAQAANYASNTDESSDEMGPSTSNRNNKTRTKNSEAKRNLRSKDNSTKPNHKISSPMISDSDEQEEIANTISQQRRRRINSSNTGDIPTKSKEKVEISQEIYEILKILCYRLK
uniref:DET1- and DDB1-associated protein 1 N-terminal domain-containing protein n=1 Tax=Ditylenchus dipsaci TaxID=166011 RepID=A0A915DB37_9BILA